MSQFVQDGDLILPELAAKIDFARQPTLQKQAGRLMKSVRQEEVLRLMVRGLNTGAIAAELGLAPRTVRQHLRAAYDKMGVEDRWQALEWLSRRGRDE
ncbi:MAG: response regulator transcription factor [Chloroflexi bacterium]|nr:response regulator transcription factor [Chloroflexota bacterium]